MRLISDKEMEVVDLDRLFEEYVETDLFQQYSDSTTDRSSSDDLAQFFGLPSSNKSDLFETTSNLDREADATWHKAVLKFGQNSASSFLDDSSSSLSVKLKEKESSSDSELLSFENLFELEKNQQRSVSQPSTPRPQTSRSLKQAASFYDRSSTRGIHKSSKKSPTASFVKKMQPSYYRFAIPDVWTRETNATIDSYHVRSHSNNINSPPLSSKIVPHENGNGFFAQDHQPYTSSPSPKPNADTQTPSIDFSNYQLTPQASPGIGLSGSNNVFHENMGIEFNSTTVASRAALSALQTPPSSLTLPMTTWGLDTSPGMDLGFSASPDFSGTKTADWWDDDSTPASHDPTYRGSNAHSTLQNLSLVSAGMDSLGISCDTSAFNSDFGGLGLGVSLGDEGYGTSGASASSHFDMAPYAQAGVYPASPHHGHHVVSIGRPPLSRSPSPTPQPRFHRRCLSSRSIQQSQPRSSQSSAASRRKSSTNSQTSSRQPSTGNVGFVNFTPDDSRKILTGVAPSGSSKTKARREKEAADKRRKLSEAVKAIMDAGGDVGSLKRLEQEAWFALES